MSVYNTELSKINISILYKHFTLANYILFLVIGFSICLYLYILEKAACETYWGKFKIFDYFVKIAYYIFVFLLLSPLFLIAVFIDSNLLLGWLFKDKLIFFIFEGVSIFICMLLSVWTSEGYLKSKINRIKEQLSDEEIIELDEVIKLYIDGYFSHSIIESQKVIETHLYKLLISDGTRVAKRNFNDLLNQALQLSIIDRVDLEKIEKIRKLRNSAVHQNIEITKDDADFAVGFVKELIKKR